MMINDGIYVRLQPEFIAQNRINENYRFFVFFRHFIAARIEISQMLDAYPESIRAFYAAGRFIEIAANAYKPVIESGYVLGDLAELPGDMRALHTLDFLEVIFSIEAGIIGDISMVILDRFYRSPESAGNYPGFEFFPVEKNEFTFLLHIPT